ncbi:hypothetical protein EIN_166990 [Entamoeba invadens IP1]|uniref:EGF-like domain-containing protein n=1 Tax=Entamoeba invadens IP1 TaxID=370355 RepID=A0A0A1TVI9_ENTIV|nr:hypothetical protein EIN_166990 [Entamoeba invadens IP1]ELP84434.1 hypothetical protein EIN_166990 [Entamoeba invadens IP1]|eukprot:XP_004183780.1 hypothetical protein EIN_166990 [Entamoeba invadens IP1]
MLFFSSILIYTIQTLAYCGFGCLGCYTPENKNEEVCSKCKDTYRQTASCTECELFNPYENFSNTNPLVLMFNNDCIVTKTDNATLYYNTDNAETLLFNEPKTFLISKETTPVLSICHDEDTNNLYRFGKYFKIYIPPDKNKHYTNILVQKNISEGVIKVDLTHDIVNNSTEPKCFSTTHVKDKLGYLISRTRNTETNFTVFVGMSNAFECEITVTLMTSENMLQYLNFPVFDVSNLTQNVITRHVDFAQVGVSDFGACSSQTFAYKFFYFRLTGDVPLGSRILFSSSSSETQIFEYIKCENVTNVYGKCSCESGIRMRRDLWKLNPETGFLFSPNETKLDDKIFKLFSRNNLMRTDLSMKIICPNQCSENEGGGNCSVQFGKCVCVNASYGGDDCHKLCYYNSEWTIPNIEEKCYYGTKQCDSDCNCVNNTILYKHYCVSAECYNNSDSLYFNNLCKHTDTHCMPNCVCEEGYTFVVNKCVIQTCGNGVIDHDEEECDLGENCDSMYCLCYNGYTKDQNNTGSCMKENYLLVIIFVTIGSGVLLLFFIIMTVFIILITQKERFIVKNINEATEYPQPNYYFDSLKLKELKFGDNNFPLNKEYATFGMKGKTLKIDDTVYEIFEITNRSTKPVLIIFHSPNENKYSIHFCPQTQILSRGTTKQVVLLFTPHCTTKLDATQICVSVYYGERQLLISFQKFLYEKMFLTDEENFQYTQFIQKIQSFYLTFGIKGKVESSLKVDSDEVFLSSQNLETKKIRN